MFMGIENEYTCFAVKRGTDVKNVYISVSSDLGELTAAKRELFISFENDQRMFHEGPASGLVWLKNGGKLYNDCSTVEYASPECISLEELVLAEKAGEFIVRRVCEPYREANDLFLMKRSAAGRAPLWQQRSTWGSHENYSVSRNLFSHIGWADRAESKILVAYLASRLVYAGSGYLRCGERERGPHFQVSPRIHLLDVTMGSGTRQSGRSLVNTKDEPHMSGNLRHQARLHLILGDMSRSDWSIYLKIGVTALVLAFLECANENELKSLVSRIAVDVPLSLATHASDVSSNEKHAAVFERCVDIQMIVRDEILKKRESVSQRFPEYDSVIEFWSGALCAARQAVFGQEGAEYKFFSSRLDWLIKKNVFEAKAGEKLEAFPQLQNGDLVRQLLSLDFSYHRVNTADFYRHLVEIGLADEMFPPEKTGLLVFNPPQGRAKTRVETVNYLRKQGWLSYLLKFDFKEIVLEERLVVNGRNVTIPLDDTPIEELLSKIAAVIKSFRR